MSEWIMKYLDPIGVVIGLLIAIPVIWTWYQVVFGSKRKHKKWLNEIINSPGDRPGILIIDILPSKSVETAITQYCQQDPNLKEIPKDRIFCIRHNKSLTPNNIQEFHKEISRISSDILEAGVDKLHYFHAGPAIAASFVGAEFSNSMPVILYQNNSSDVSGYTNFGPLSYLDR